MFKIFRICNFNVKSKLPIIISGLLINNKFGHDFSLARMFEQKYYVKILNDNDIDLIKEKYIKRIEEAEYLHIDIRDNIMDKKKFVELFEIFGNTKKEDIHIDLSNTQLDDEKLDAVVKCFGNWDLKGLNLHVSNVDLSNKQFDQLMNCIEKMKNLRNLNLEMENVNLNVKKRYKIEEVINSMKNLNHVSINLRNNNLTDEDASSFTKLLDRFDIRHFFF